MAYTGKPLYVLHGQNHLRFFAIFLLVGIITLSIYLSLFMGFMMFYLIIVAIFGLVCIRFPKLYLFENHFIIEKKSIIPKYTDHDIFKYDEIEDVNFLSGHTDWAKLILQTIFAEGSTGGFSKPDQMIVKLKNNQVRFFYRFGSQKRFVESIDCINSKITHRNHR